MNIFIQYFKLWSAQQAKNKSIDWFYDDIYDDIDYSITG